MVAGLEFDYVPGRLLIDDKVIKTSWRRWIATSLMVFHNSRC